MPEKLGIIARAPSNIALIKYMGKKDAGLNIPENPSISFTLNDLCTWVEICRTNGTGMLRLEDGAPRFPSGMESALPCHVPALDATDKQRVIDHVNRVITLAPDLLASFGLPVQENLRSMSDFVVRTANTFPAFSGIASSASSFAALTLAGVLSCVSDTAIFLDAWAGNDLRKALSRLSRMGSGSSCRSFFGPWVLWDGSDAEAFPTGMPKFCHFALVVSDERKPVSSSEAHRLVKSSPLWNGRPERAMSRSLKMKSALESGDVKTVSRVSWLEAWEMHSMFHTCIEPFSYWRSGTVAALQWLSPFLKEGSPPVVTMDAGPNIHIFVEESRAAVWRDRIISYLELRAAFGEKEKFLEDHGGDGASF
ncbi:MAG: hypothetical protein AABZ06_07075 [Bdellovibrionota bacterium]